MQPGLMRSATDGKGVSLVYYFALPEGFELEHVENTAAIRLLQHFVQDGTEANGCFPFFPFPNMKLACMPPLLPAA